MSKYYVEVTITGKAKVWVESKKELEEFIKDGKQSKEDFLKQSNLVDEELIEWESENILKIEKLDDDWM